MQSLAKIFKPWTEEIRSCAQNPTLAQIPSRNNQTRTMVNVFDVEKLDTGNPSAQSNCQAEINLGIDPETPHLGVLHKRMSRSNN